MTHYNWQRRWFEQNDPDRSTDQRLFYRRHLRIGGERVSDNTFSLHELSDMPCVILLGEPGMGKSQAILDFKAEVASLNQQGTLYSFQNLNSENIEDKDDFHSEVFDDNQTFQDWLRGDQVLYLFLDSFDEAKLNIRTIQKRLARQLREHREHIHRLRLRLVCRTADWEPSFESTLKDLWFDKGQLAIGNRQDEADASFIGQTDSKTLSSEFAIATVSLEEPAEEQAIGEPLVKVFVLAPLGDEDVIQAAMQRGIDSDEFMGAVDHRQVRPLTSSPATLTFLLNEYVESGGQFPQSRIELYRKGCLSLCRLLDTNREEGVLEPEQRFAIAARLAAFSVFTNRDTFQLNQTVTDTQRVLRPDDCSDSVLEDVGGTEIRPYARKVEEVLKTSLFKGGERKQWVQRTYVEFLAAWYINARLEWSQIKELILHPQGGLIPQLEEVTIWLADLNSKCFDLVLNLKPELLVRGELFTKSHEMKRQLVQALFERISIFPNAYISYWRMGELRFPNIADLLVGILADQGKPFISRDLAIDIANQTASKELAPLLSQIALNEDEEIRLRIEAVKCVIALDCTDARAALLPLAQLPSNSKDNVELKLLGVEAVWPRHLTAAQLFETLAEPPDNETQIGYRSKRWAELILPHLWAEDIPIALDWVGKFQKPWRLEQSIQDLENGVLRVAWEHLELAGISECFAQALVSRVRFSRIFQTPNDYTGRDPTLVFDAQIVSDDSKNRHVLLPALIEQCFAEQVRVHLVTRGTPLILAEDIPWLIDYYGKLAGSDSQAYVVELLQDFAWAYDPASFEQFYRLQNENPGLWAALDLKLSYRIDGENARLSRKRLVEAKASRRQPEQVRPPLEPSPVERALKALERFETGSDDGWWQMSCWLECDVTGYKLNSVYHEFSMDALPAWSNALTVDRQRILDTAIDYLKRYDPDQLQWWESHYKTIYHPLVAGARAFQVATEQDEEDLGQLQKAWVSALTYIFYSELRYSQGKEKRLSTQRNIVTLYRLSSDSVIETLKWIVEVEDSQSIFWAERLGFILDEDIAVALLETSEEGAIGFSSVQAIWYLVAKFDFASVEPYLLSATTLATSTDSSEYELAIGACSVLILYGDQRIWSKVWPIFRDNPKFGVEVMRNALSHPMTIRMTH